MPPDGGLLGGEEFTDVSDEQARPAFPGLKPEADSGATGTPPSAARWSDAPADTGHVADPSAGRLIEIGEEARRKIANELHDGLAQYLMAANAHLEVFCLAENQGNRERALCELEKGLRHLKRSVLESRRLVNALRLPPFDEIGLLGALEQLLCEEKSLAAWEEAVLLPATLESRLPAALEIVLYRAAQEALSAARRHAEAREVQLTLASRTKPGTMHTEIVLEIRDRGPGFDPDLDEAQALQRALPGVQGLVAALGGDVQVRSRLGEGTIVRITLPTPTLRVGTRPSTLEGSQERLV
jgi:signal transduction histidine kinase